ncbi:UNVERIFIED_CONTAM: hypothetical protein FKN15_042353 [Acipenser sinensis]
MNTRCPPKRVPSAARFFTHCELAVQPPQSYSVGGQRSLQASLQVPGQTTGVAGARLLLHICSTWEGHLFFLIRVGSARQNTRRKSDIPLNLATLSFLFVFLPPAESESTAPDEWERAQLGVWSQEKPQHSEREWDEVIQVAVESLLERPQQLPESPTLPPRRERSMLPAPDPQRENPASPECPALPPEKENPVPQESSAPQLLSERE